MGVFGYLDAGSGSMLVGAVAAGAAGVAVAAKVSWKRVTGVFGKKQAEADPIADATDDVDDADEAESSADHSTDAS